jgi:putative hemolysin
MTLIDIILIFSLIALNGFFVSVEFAAVATRRARLDSLPQATGQAVELVHVWLEQPAARDRLIAASQLGITMVSLALGAVGENAFKAALAPVFNHVMLPLWLKFLETILPALPLFLSLIIVTSLHVVLGEQVPKVAVLRSPERVALWVAPIMQVFGVVFKGFVNVLDWATRMILSMFGLRARDAHSMVYSLDEIKQMVSGPEVESVIEQPERDMLSAVIDFGELVVRQVSIPRTEMAAVEANEPITNAIDLALERNITKLPVYEDDLDEVIGIVHLQDMVQSLRTGKAETQLVRELVREALYVPETISVNDLLHQFRVRRSHIAIVLDEYGGTYGLVTLEDLLEEIVGEVQDPFDATPPSIQMLPDGSAMIDGMTFFEEINQYLGLRLSDPYYDTIAGFILNRLGRVPEVGDTVEDRENGIHLRVEKMDHLRIAQVSLRRI